MKYEIYGCEIEEDALVEAINHAEEESIRNTHYNVSVILDTETGKLYEVTRHNSDHFVSERVWKGIDKYLYTASQDDWSPFRDWLVVGMTEDEVNGFVKDILGEEIFNEYAAKKEDEELEDPVWELIVADHFGDIEDAVAEECMPEMMENFDAYSIIEQILREAD